MYQIIDCGCADVVDDVNEKLQREDHEEKGWHDWFSEECVANVAVYRESYCWRVSDLF